MVPEDVCKTPELGGPFVGEAELEGLGGGHGVQRLQPAVVA